MYQYSLDEALRQGKPVVLEFATPGHCTVCDNQLQMIKGMLAKYESEVIFLHMDQYKNPEAFKAFRVIGDPWTFIIDQKRVVQFKQAGRMLYGELDAAIARVLMQASG
jgi:thiol-disulfide isomerase/thioredoxin